VYANGVTLGSAGALTGDGDTAATFDGSDDNVTVPDDAPLRLNGSFTIEFWARQISFANRLPGILDKGTGTLHSYAIWADSSGELWFDRHNRVAGSGGGALTAAFRYFVATYDGTHLRWYVDGVLASTTALSLPHNSNTEDLQIGNADDYGNNTIDEVAIYASALSAARVAAHYAAGS
jgi:Concanavalin A-like lectin/glucanases superfamily